MLVSLGFQLCRRSSATGSRFYLTKSKLYHNDLQKQCGVAHFNVHVATIVVQWFNYDTCDNHVGMMEVMMTPRSGL